MGSPAAKVLPRRCNTKGSNAKSKDCWKLPSCEGRCYLALRIHRPCRETEELLRLTDRFELLHLPLSSARRLVRVVTRDQTPEPPAPIANPTKAHSGRGIAHRAVLRPGVARLWPATWLPSTCRRGWAALRVGLRGRPSRSCRPDFDERPKRGLPSVEPGWPR